MTDQMPKPHKRGPYYGYDTFDELVRARPDIFEDDFDCRPPSESTFSDEDLLASAPEHLKGAARRVIEKRRSERAVKRDGGG